MHQSKLITLIIFRMVKQTTLNRENGNSCIKEQCDTSSTIPIRSDSEISERKYFNDTRYNWLINVNRLFLKLLQKYHKLKSTQPRRNRIGCLWDPLIELLLLCNWRNDSIVARFRRYAFHIRKLGRVWARAHFDRQRGTAKTIAVINFHSKDCTSPWQSGACEVFA